MLYWLSKSSHQTKQVESGSSSRGLRRLLFGFPENFPHGFLSGFVRDAHTRLDWEMPARSPNKSQLTRMMSCDGVWQGWEARTNAAVTYLLNNALSSSSSSAAIGQHQLAQPFGELSSTPSTVQQVTALTCFCDLLMTGARLTVGQTVPNTGQSQMSFLTLRQVNNGRDYFQYIFLIKPVLRSTNR